MTQSLVGRKSDVVFFRDCVLTLIELLFYGGRGLREVWQIVHGPCAHSGQGAPPSRAKAVS